MLRFRMLKVARSGQHLPSARMNVAGRSPSVRHNDVRDGHASTTTTIADHTADVAILLLLELWKLMWRDNTV